MSSTVWHTCFKRHVWRESFWNKLIMVEVLIPTTHLKHNKFAVERKLAYWWKLRLCMLTFVYSLCLFIIALLPLHSWHWWFTASPHRVPSAGLVTAGLFIGKLTNWRNHMPHSVKGNRYWYLESISEAENQSFHSEINNVYLKTTILRQLLLNIFPCWSA